MRHYHIAPHTVLAELWQHRQLIWQMVRREIVGRYRGSLMGLLWSFFNPVLMLVVYTFVFSVVFQAKWGQGGGGSKTEFAVILFAGLIVFNLFAEVVNRAPNLVLEQVNFVKKVVFPLEILPVVILGSALFHACVSLCVLVLFKLLIQHTISLTLVLLPLVLLPLLLLVLGCAWFLASLGVFLRAAIDIITILTTALLFMSPIFFPVTAIPADFRSLMLLNPLAFIVEQARNVLLWGNVPDWQGLLTYSLASLFVAWAGLAWFQKTRKGFADVL